MAYAVAISQRTSLGVAAQSATERFHIGASVLSSFAVLQLLTYAVMQVPVGVLVDRFGSRVMTRPGSATSWRQASADVRESFLHPGTRLGLWSHFSTQFCGMVFALLWGFPFLTIGLGSPTWPAGY